MGPEIQMADLLLRVGRVLEHDRCRLIRVHDQSANRPLLHAGLEYDTAPRTRRAIRSVRDAGHWPHADVFASADSWPTMERWHADEWASGA